MTTWLPGDVATVEAFDAEACPDPVPADVEVAQPYIFGSSAAAIWDVHELARVRHLHKLPICVPTPGTDDPRKVASQLANRMVTLGMPRGGYGDGGLVSIMWDLETGREPDNPWLKVAADRLHAHGFGSYCYGSEDVIYHYDQRRGYIVANPTGERHLVQHEGATGTQYAWGVIVPGGRINRSALARDMLRDMWRPAS